MLGHFQPDWLFQLQRQDSGHSAKGLEFAGGLMVAGLR
jgi:hypothetical protein